MLTAYRRTTVLFRFFSVFLVAELVGNPLGGFLLSRGPWVSLITGNVFIVLVLMSLYILPETLVVRRWHDAKAGKTPSPRLAPLDGSDDERLKKSSISAALDDARDQLVEVWEFLIGNKRIVVLMLPLIFMTLGKYIQEMLLQYATKRYGWSWSKVCRSFLTFYLATYLFPRREITTNKAIPPKATYFLTLKSASFIIMLTVILPAVSSFCLKRLGMSPLSKDLWLSRWSGVMLVVADLAVAFSFTPALFGAGLVLLSGGCGLTPLLRSLLNAQVEPHHVGILNTLLGFLDTLGVMIAAPIFSESLNKGIELGGAWIGLPFVAGAVISCFAAGILWVYRIPPQVERSVLEEDHV